MVGCLKHDAARAAFDSASSSRLEGLDFECCIDEPLQVRNPGGSAAAPCSC